MNKNKKYLAQFLPLCELRKCKEKTQGKFKGETDGKGAQGKKTSVFWGGVDET